MKPTRIALLTSPSTASAEAVYRLVGQHSDRIAIVGLSDPLRQPFGAPGARTRKILINSRLRLAPYLFVTFVLPRIAAFLKPASGKRSLATLCRETRIPLAAFDDINDPASIAQLQGAGAETVLMFHFDQIVSAAFIAAFDGAVVNVHPALLPRHRGAAPTIHALIDDAPAFGVTLHRVSAAIDDGPILAQSQCELPPETSAVDAAFRLHLAGLPLVSAWLAGELRDETLPESAPYRHWPDAAPLRALARRGRRLTRLKDIARAWFAPV